MLEKNVDVYRDEYGNVTEIENWISHGRVLKNFRVRGILPKSYKLDDFSNLLCKYGILYSVYDKECFKIKYSCWGLQDEFAYLINEGYIKPSGYSFKWSTKGIEWINKFFDDKDYKNKLI
ncbi:hypothetical protein [Paraclostridium sordellii]|uniref:hypothetical protein n=1 Tax=Paraclostridium sordellii TaxID=1505 RepID=UPI0012D73D42|nr:hypothetical protein [Paeniclostridium sordellii]